MTLTEEDINQSVPMTHLIALVARVGEPTVCDHQIHAVWVPCSYPVSKVVNVGQLVHIASAVHAIADLKRLILVVVYRWQAPIA